MKKQVLFIASIVTLLTVSVQAKIWRVNNNTVLKADFTTIQEAHDAPSVSSGDTLHIEPSAIEYSGATLRKKIIIMGSGYFLSENPNSQANKTTARIENIIFKKESEGSALIGLTLRGVIIDSASNILITRNDIFGSNVSITGSVPIANIVISGNYGLSIVVTSAANISNVIISNNYITNLVHSEYFSNVRIENNIFDINTSSRLGIGNASVKNNIFYNYPYSAGIYIRNSSFYNNIDCSTSYIPTGNGNLRIVNKSDIFLGLTGNSTDGQWQLKSGSPAKGAGLGGTDCGIFGGTNPYVLSGIPSVPAFYELHAPSSSNGNTLNITFSVKNGN